MASSKAEDSIAAPLSDGRLATGVCLGDAFAAEEAVRAVATDYPDTAFAFGSCCEEQAPNFSVFDNWMQDPGYLAGMLAGGLTESGTIGVVAAMPIPEVNRIVNAFVLGVGETNADATVNVSFINSFFDPVTAAQAAEAQIAQGADVLFAERAGVIEIADENDLPVIGMMVDQQELAPDNVVTSLVWNMQPTVEALVEQVSDGSYEAQNLAQYSFMINGGSSIAPINTDIVVEVPDDLVALVEERQAEILSGDFETPIDEEAARRFDRRHAVGDRWEPDAARRGGWDHQAFRRARRQRRHQPGDLRR